MKKILQIAVANLLLVCLLCSVAMAVPETRGTSQAPGLYPKDDIGRIDIIHYAKNTAPAASRKSDPGYKLMGVKWPASKLPAAFAVNTDSYYANVANPILDQAGIQDAITKAAGEWDAYTSRELFSDTRATTTNAYGVQDYCNTIAFGPYSDNRAIAVTSVWYIRSTGAIIEFDMIFNTAFTWGNADGNPSVMDLQNIATHELGHSVGLADVYSTGTGANTMYGYSSYGETMKRSLEKPDWTGLQKMYGI